FEKTSGGTTGTTGNAIDLLYFSMCTLTTVGYGDIVPVRPVARMLAGLEATTGVLYVAITVSLLVSGYKARPRPRRGTAPGTLCPGPPPAGHPAEARPARAGRKAPAVRNFPAPGRSQKAHP